ncbi:hypothetical protein [Citrobacter portucalensis]|nr:hypothetical protein [Citrobacter portucalensis]
MLPFLIGLALATQYLTNGFTYLLGGGGAFHIRRCLHWQKSTRS